VHEALGRQAEIDGVVDRFAERGFAAVAPDLFATGKPFCIFRAMREVGTGQGVFFDQLRQARAWLADQGVPAERIGIIGFCLGGGFALAAGPGWAAVSANYGFVPTDAALAGGPLFACFGANDRMLRGEPEKLRAALDRVGREGTIEVIPGVGHGFLTRSDRAWMQRLREIAGSGYDPAVADAVWQRIFAFFDERMPI
jgi:carboxymethylenebutenolidase